MTSGKLEGSQFPWTPIRELPVKCGVTCYGLIDSLNSVIGSIRFFYRWLRVTEVLSLSNSLGTKACSNKTTEARRSASLLPRAADSGAEHEIRCPSREKRGTSRVEDGGTITTVEIEFSHQSSPLRKCMYTVRVLDQSRLDC